MTNTHISVTNTEATSKILAENIADNSHANDTDEVNELILVAEEIKDEVKTLKTELVSSFFLYRSMKFIILSEK